MTVTTLASGSSGNCLLVSEGDTHLLVDAGISARRIGYALAKFGLGREDLTAVLITHEHSDHICGLATLTKNFSFPLYASGATGRQLCYRLAVAHRLCDFEPGEGFTVGGLEVRSIPTSHDTAGSVGYAITNAAGRRAAVVTDLGAVTEEVRAGVAGSHLLVVETNHDIPTLKAGPYPYYLKERILSDHGHLSNEAGAELAAQAAAGGAHTLVLAHLSAENNRPSLARRAVEEALSARGLGRVTVTVAPRTEPGEPLEV